MPENIYDLRRTPNYVHLFSRKLFSRFQSLGLITDRDNVLSPLLEIGAGGGLLQKIAERAYMRPINWINLDKNIEQLREEYKSRITDGGAGLLFLQSDAKNLHQIPDNTVPHVVSLCGIDAQSKPDILQSLQEVHHVLVPGGSLQILRDLPPSPIPLIQHVAQQSETAIFFRERSFTNEHIVDQQSIATIDENLLIECGYTSKDIIEYRALCQGGNEYGILECVSLGNRMFQHFAEEINYFFSLGYVVRPASRVYFSMMQEVITNVGFCNFQLHPIQLNIPCQNRIVSMTPTNRIQSQDIKPTSKVTIWHMSACKGS
ncbi:class I SAM-dependent methyltransferase [Candidatus Woesebacteria bacterium]|nr:class I SAM-dependent methyltransferase [Candidatus Woesebacteria bacterium]